MKLWMVSQWGNTEDGPDGHDTNCIVRAPDLSSAVKIAEEYFARMYKAWKEGKADVAFLMGEDSSSSDEAKVVIHSWINPAFNLAHYPAWYRKYWDGDEWGSQKEIYGED